MGHSVFCLSILYFGGSNREASHSRYSITTDERIKLVSTFFRFINMLRREWRRTRRIGRIRCRCGTSASFVHKVRSRVRFLRFLFPYRSYLHTTIQAMILTISLSSPFLCTMHEFRKITLGCRIMLILSIIRCQWNTRTCRSNHWGIDKPSTSISYKGASIITEKRVGVVYEVKEIGSICQIHSHRVW